MGILRAFKYIFLCVFISILLSIISIRIPCVQRKVITAIFNVYSNQYFKLSFGDSNISGLATVDIYNVKILINSNNHCLNVDKISINFNIFNIILDSKIVVECLKFNDFEINIDELLGKINKTNGNNSYSSTLRFFKFVFKSVNLENFVINFNDGKNKLKTTMNINLSDFEINAKNMRFNLNLKLKNKYITVQDLSGEFSYYFMSDSISGSKIRLLTSYFNFTGDIFLSRFSELIKNNFLFYGFDGRINMVELVLLSRNINKELNIQKFIGVDENIVLNGRIIKNKDVLTLKNIKFKYKNKISDIDFNIDNVINLKNCRYVFSVQHGPAFIKFVDDMFDIGLKKTIFPLMTDLVINVNGNNEEIDGDVIIFNNENKFNIKSKINTNISNVLTNGINTANIVDKANVIIHSKGVTSDYLKDLSIGEFLFSFNYISKTKKSNFLFTLDDISFKMLKFDKIKYKGSLVRNYIIADLEILSEKFKILAKNNLSLENLSGLLEGKVLTNNLLQNKLDADSVICDFNLNLSNVDGRYELRKLINNIKIDINNVPVEIGDINGLFTYKNGIIDAHLTSEIIDVDINKANIIAIINDLNIVKLRLLNLWDKERTVKSINNYNTKVTITVKRQNLFNLFFYDIIDSGEIYVELYFSNLDGLIKNKMMLDVKNIIFIDNEISELSFNLDNILDMNGKFVVSSDVKCKRRDDDVNLGVHIVLLRNLIKSKITLDNKNGNIVNSNFNIDISEGVYLDISNVGSYIRLLNGNLIAEGTMKYDFRCVDFSNFSVYNKRRDVTYLAINGRYDLDVTKRLTDFSVLINNIVLNDINILWLNNLKCKISGKTTMVNDKINVNLLLKDLSIYGIDYKNIDIGIDTIMKNNIDKRFFNLSLKQYNESSEIANIVGKLFFSNGISFLLNISLDDFELICLRPLFYNILDIKKGFISANYELKGGLDNILVDGNGTIKNLGIQVFSNGGYYDNISGDLFSSNSNEIGIYSIKVYQQGIECGNLNANISLKKLFDPVFTIEGKLKKCRIFNKTSNDTYFYGLLNGTGDLKLILRLGEIFVNGKINVDNGNLHILSDEGSEKNMKMYTSKITILNKLYKRKKNKLKTQLDLDINFNKDTDIYLEFNVFNNLYLTGDGDVSIKFDDELKLNGTYNVSYGTYNIKFGDFLSKRFVIKNGKVSFNNYLQYSNINIYAISDLYNVNIDNKMSNVFLEVTLDGNIHSPNINYSVLLADNSAKKFNNDLKTFFSILFFNNFNSNQLTTSANTFINDLCSRVSGIISKNISLKVNSNLINILFNRQFRSLNFDISYNLSDNISIEKPFDFSNYKNLYMNLSLNINTELKNNILQSIKLFKISHDEDKLNGKNIVSYNLHRSFNF